MKSFAFTLALLTALTAFGTSSAHAQSIGSVSDYYNDYEVYTAEWQTNWYSVVTWDDGTETEYFSYSQQGAQDWALWLYLHLSNVEDVDVVSREELSSWEYVDTFATYSLAAAEADAWEKDGYETDIRAIRVNWTLINFYRPFTGKFYLKK